MKKNKLLGICLTLLMLVMTACGASETPAPGSVQGYEDAVLGGLLRYEDAAPGNGQGQEDASLGNSQDQGDAAPGNSQDQGDAATEDSQDQGDAAPENSQDQKDASSENSQGYEDTDPESLQENEPQTQESTAGTEEHFQETFNDNLPEYGEYYYDVVNVVLYLEFYDELPPNYITKSEAQSLGWEGGSVEKYKEGAAIGGDYFGNREGLLPKADGRSYTECDIDTKGYSSRGSRRLVFSNDGLYFYTSDHYETFLEVTVTEDYEVIW